MRFLTLVENKSYGKIIWTPPEEDGQRIKEISIPLLRERGSICSKLQWRTLDDGHLPTASVVDTDACTIRDRLPVVSITIFLSGAEHHCVTERAAFF